MQQLPEGAGRDEGSGAPASSTAHINLPSTPPVLPACRLSLPSRLLFQGLHQRAFLAFPPKLGSPQLHSTRRERAELQGCGLRKVGGCWLQMFSGACSQLRSAEFAQRFLVSTFRVWWRKPLLRVMYFSTAMKPGRSKQRCKGKSSEPLGTFPSMGRALSNCRLLQVIPSQPGKGLSCQLHSLTLETALLSTCSHRSGVSTGHLGDHGVPRAQSWQLSS